MTEIWERVDYKYDLSTKQYSYLLLDDLENKYLLFCNNVSKEILKWG